MYQKYLVGGLRDGEDRECRRVARESSGRGGYKEERERGFKGEREGRGRRGRKDVRERGEDTKRGREGGWEGETYPLI